MEEMTPEQIDQSYRSTMDSVSVVNEFVGEDPLTQNGRDAIKRNVEHLKIMLGKTYWTEDHDLTPFETAVAEGEAVLAE
jgi:hypothetical protein